MKRLLLALMLVASFAFVASATGPWNTSLTLPWGTDCSDWEWLGPPYLSGELIWSPTQNAYLVCGTGSPVVWPTLTIDYFLELETVVNYDWTAAQVHRASNYDDVVLELCGDIHSNSGNIIAMQGAVGLMPLIEAVVTGQTGPPMDVSWDYKIDLGSYAPMLTGYGGKYFTVGSCDHDFCIRITIDVEYHQTAGWYQLLAIMCPEGGL